MITVLIIKSICVLRSGMFCIIKFSDHLSDDLKKEFADINLPVSQCRKALFWELQVYFTLCCGLDRLTCDALLMSCD